MASRRFRLRERSDRPELGISRRADDFISSPACGGIDPHTDTLVSDDEARIRQAFLNLRLIAESEGASLRDAVRLVVFVTDMFPFRPIVNKVQEELWGGAPYPPRTIIEVHRLRMTSSRLRVLSTRRSRGAAKSDARFANPWSYLQGQGRPISASEHSVAGTRQSPDPPLRIYVLLLRIRIAHE
jgi:enamine deaminase RidA (YjgF/YER057c/UK114 family)